jgi:hypothetical protein
VESASVYADRRAQRRVVVVIGNHVRDELLAVGGEPRRKRKRARTRPQGLWV